MQGIGYAFTALATLGIAAGFFAATFFLLRMGKEQVLALLLWFVFFFWQMVPIMVEGYSPGVNFSEIARYPVSFRLYFLLNAVYGLVDPAAMACLLWLFSMWLGVLGARPEWALAAAGMLALFAAFNLFCNRLIIGIFERYQSTRKGRERVAALMLLVMLLPQLIQFVVNGWIDVRRYHLPPWTGEALIRLHQVSPPGQVSQALSTAGAQRLLPIVALLAYILVIAWLLARRLRNVYQGEAHAESFKIKSELKVKPGWRIPGLDEKLSAVLEKELHYLRQNVRLLVQLVYPVLLVAVLVLGGPRKRAINIANGGVVLGIFAGMMGLAVSNLSYNTFGLDREGFGRWLLSPLSLRKVLVAKNLAQGAVMSALYLGVGFVMMSFTHVSWDMFLAVTAGFFTVLIVQIGAGNVISVHWPKRIELTKMSSRTASGAAGFMALGFTLPLMAIVGLVVFATLFWKLAWLPLAAGVTGLVLALGLYSILVDRAASYAGEHLEDIAKELGA